MTDDSTYIEAMQWVIEQLLPTYERHAEHAHECERDTRHYPQDLRLMDLDPCTACDTLALIAYAMNNEQLPELPIFLDAITRENN